jgi:hypothetical protein
VAEDRAHYSGKHQRHGINVQILADPRGRRAPGERAVATLKTWKILAKLPCCPRRRPHRRLS